MHNRFLIAVLILFTVFITSCRKDLPDHLFDQWKPTLAVPVGSMSITLADLIPTDDTTVVIDDEGLISFAYHKDSVFSFDVSKFFEIPSQTPTIESFKLGELSLDDFGPLSSTIHLYEMLDKIDPLQAASIQALDGLTAPLPSMISQATDTFVLNEADNYKSVTFSSGSIYVKATNNLPVAFDSITLIPQSYDQDNMETLPECHFYNFQPGETQTQPIPLQNQTLYSMFRVIVYQFRTIASGSPVPISLNAGVVVTVTTSDLKVTHGIAKIPEQVFTSESENLNYICEGDERLTHAHFSQAKMNYQINSSIGAIIHGTSKFKSVTFNGGIDTASMSFNINPNAGVYNTWSFPNSDFDFSTIPQQPYNMLPVNYQIWIDATNNFVEFDSQDSIYFSFTLNNLNFSSVQGFFGEKTIDVDADTISTNIVMLSNISGSVTLVNPKMNIIVTNSIGVPSNLNLELINHSNDGNIYDLNAPTFIIPYPSTIGESAQSSFPVTIANSNISAFLSHIPEKLEFSGNMSINPEGFIDYSNFVTNQGKVKVGVEFDLPLELKVSNLTFKDTALLELHIEDFDQLESTKLYMFIKNGFPFDLSLELCVFNSISNIQYDQFSSSLITAAEVNAQGRVIQPATSLVTFELDRNRIDNVLQSDKVAVTAILNTSNNGSIPVKIYTDYKIDVKLSAKATGNLDNNDIEQ